MIENIAAEGIPEEAKNTAAQNITEDIENSVPETPEGYEIPISEELPYSEKTERSFKELAHRLKLTSFQARELSSWASAEGEENLRLSYETAAKHNADSMEILKKEWGLNCEANLSQAVRAAESLAEGFPEFKNFLEETRVGSDPRFIKTMAKIGRMLGEDSLPYSGPAAKSSGYAGGMPVLDFASMGR